MSASRDSPRAYRRYMVPKKIHHSTEQTEIIGLLIGLFEPSRSKQHSDCLVGNSGH